MPAQEKVSIGWQIVFAIIPMFHVWAFYRVKKLRKYILFIVIPFLVIGMINNLTMDDDGFFGFSLNPEIMEGIDERKSLEEHAEKQDRKETFQELFDRTNSKETALEDESVEEYSAEGLIADSRILICWVLAIFLLYRWSKQWNTQFPNN